MRGDASAARHAKKRVFHETIRDLGAICKDLRKRAGTIQRMIVKGTRYERARDSPTDDIESKAPPKRVNLSPALRDAITRDVAQNVSKYEPRLPRTLYGKFKSNPYDSSLREGSVQPKAAFLLQPPKAPE